MSKIVMIIVVLVSLLLFVPEVSQAQQSAPMAAPQPAPDVPVEIEAAVCPIRVPEARNVECGYLIVPADYDDPAGDKLRLPYITLHSRSGDSKPDPIIFTVGGPGYSSLDSIWGFVNSSLSEDRDIIIFEQRGNLHAQPALTCDRLFWWDESGNMPCKDSLEEQGIEDK